MLAPIVVCDFMISNSSRVSFDGLAENGVGNADLAHVVHGGRQADLFGVGRRPALRPGQRLGEQSGAEDVHARFHVAAGRGRHQPMDRLFVGMANGHGLLPDLLLQALRILAALDQHLPLGDRFAGLQDQLLARDRFDQVTGSPAPQDVDRRAGFLHGGDHQHHDVGTDRENLFQQLGAGPARQGDVEGHQVHAAVAEMMAGRRGVLGLQAFEALVAEPAGNERSHVELVVHDQRPFRLGARRAAALGRNRPRSVLLFELGRPEFLVMTSRTGLRPDFMCANAGPNTILSGF